MRKMLDPAWLYETNQTADFAQRAEEWSTFGTRGVEIVPHPNGADRKVLQIRKTDEHWPAAAVWNFPAGADGRLRLRILPRSRVSRGPRFRLRITFRRRTTWKTISTACTIFGSGPTAGCRTATR